MNARPPAPKRAELPPKAPSFPSVFSLSNNLGNLLFRLKATQDRSGRRVLSRFCPGRLGNPLASVADNVLGFASKPPTKGVRCNSVVDVGPFAFDPLHQQSDLLTGSEGSVVRGSCPGCSTRPQGNRHEPQPEKCSWTYFVRLRRPLSRRGAGLPTRRSESGAIVCLCDSGNLKTPIYGGHLMSARDHSHDRNRSERNGRQDGDITPSGGISCRSSSGARRIKGLCRYLPTTRT